jgi:hypothetical protein
MAAAKEAEGMTEQALNNERHDSAATGDRRRWMALYVL